MTKKDYIKLAQALKDSRPIVPDTKDIESDSQMLFTASMNQWIVSVDHIAQTLQFDNPQFNRARFLHACGYTQEG